MTDRAVGSVATPASGGPVRPQVHHRDHRAASGQVQAPGPARGQERLVAGRAPTPRRPVVTRRAGPAQRHRHVRGAEAVRLDHHLADLRQVRRRSGAVGTAGTSSTGMTQGSIGRRRARSARGCGRRTRAGRAAPSQRWVSCVGGSVTGTVGERWLRHAAHRDSRGRPESCPQAPTASPGGRAEPHGRRGTATGADAARPVVGRDLLAGGDRTGRRPVAERRTAERPRARAASARPTCPGPSG